MRQITQFNLSSDKKTLYVSLRGEPRPMTLKVGDNIDLENRTEWVDYIPKGKKK
jgi:hypothetical protein